MGSSATWRLHPDICRFISDTAYEGRLKPNENTARRCITLPADARVIPRGTGIVLDEVEHEGNIQFSEEEAERVAEIVEELRRATVQEDDGTRHAFDIAKDLLIVAPYNAQVRCLKERLKDPAIRIASVDKFQGQEASVVILSMCASSLDETGVPAQSQPVERGAVPGSVPRDRGGVIKAGADEAGQCGGDGAVQPLLSAAVLRSGTGWSGGRAPPRVKRRSVLAVLLTAAIMAGLVWYAVSRFPQIPGRVAVDVEFPPRGPASCGGHCGTERWTVKTLSDLDRDRDRVDLHPVDATIEELISLSPPAVLPPFNRIAPVELTVYRVEARLVALFGEDDQDYHLVLASPRNPALTMIAEIPDARCAGSCASGFGERYAQVRQRLFDRLNATGGERQPLIRVTGVGFFDYIHGQNGVAPNGIELHPVLEVEFPR